MYILKNALLNIIRTKGRTILISIIIVTISLAACIGLSIRQAAETAKEESLNQLNITAQISIDRNSLMQNSGGDKSSFSNILNSANALDIDDMLKYSTAESVSSFYYSKTISLNGTENFNPVSTSNTTSSSSNDLTSSKNSSTKSNGFKKGSWGVQGDFTLIGYNTVNGMTNFNNGISTITEGNLFEDSTENFDCIISNELATFNNLSVGENIIVSNPNNEEELYTLTIVGIYNNLQSSVSNSSNMTGFSTSSDPANQIYLSYNAIDKLTLQSSENAQITIDSTSGEESTTAIPSQISDTYVFDSLEAYNNFETEARDLGLEDIYTISSSDVNSYEQSLVPLNNLSKMAGYFLVVVISIGALILVVLNIFNIRERKYEVGVLTAIGMKKWKVASQFICEILIISLLSVSIGGGIGAVFSVPVTNSLLESQVLSEENSSSEKDIETGRNKFSNNKTSFNFTNINYISEVSSAVNITVLFQLLGVFILLTIIASTVSVIFIMRYEPLKILSNRD